MLRRVGLGAISLSLALSGCATGARRSKPPAAVTDKERVPLDKIGSKDSADDDGSATGKVVARGPSLNAQLKFLRLHSRTGSTFGAAEHEFVATLAKEPKRGSVAEAALYVGVMNQVVHPLGQAAPSFVEEDLLSPSGAAVDTTPKPSLAGQVRAVGLDPVEALKQNRWLQHYGVATLTMAALSATSDPEDFRAPLEGEVRRQANLWAKLSGREGALELPAEAEPTPVPADTMSEAPLSPADLKSGDAILMEAQTLAGRGRYRDAISIASRIPEDDPMHQAAQERIVQYSNQAVQDLRQKAAQAFQKAIPVSDRGARAAHLKEAQAYLQEAIQNYPTADQLPTVRNNLEVISRDLERLNEESGEEDNG